MTGWFVGKVLNLDKSNIINKTLPTLSEKIGLMLMIGFRGLAVDDNSPVVADIISGRIGGVILFDRDVTLNSDVRNIQSLQQVKDLISSLKSFCKEKLLVSVDQEGGQVNRLKEKYGFPASVSQEYLGKLNNPETTAFYGKLTATTLSECGFNLNFAPDADLNTNPDNPVLGKKERCFSADPAIVTEHTEIIIDEHHKKNVLCTIKHFPGHGSSTADSHLGFVNVTNTWDEIELIPFKNIIEDGKADLIMTAHIFNSNLDEKYPATLSKNVIDGILRKQLGFDGVVISDDMNMKAISDHYGLEQAIELAINAGVDILMFGNNVVFNENIASEAMNIIEKLVRNGKITEDRVDESYRRIMKMKETI